MVLTVPQLGGGGGGDSGGMSLEWCVYVYCIMFGVGARL